jgi:hypothetical protein
VQFQKSNSSIKLHNPDISANEISFGLYEDTNIDEVISLLDNLGAQATTLYKV